MSEEAKWYVVHTYSGYENKVKEDLEKTIKNRDLGDIILEVKYPTEEVVEVKDDSNEIPDGMKIDVNGNIFTTGAKGIWIINNKARLLGRINLPEVAANLNWGGPDRNILYITASTGLYRITTLTKG